MDSQYDAGAKALRKEASFIKDGERIDDLQRGGLKIIQGADQFSFSTDAVLLAAFASLKKKDKVLDLGSGAAAIPLLLYGRYGVKTIKGLEIQPFLVDRGRRSILMNGLEDTIEMVEGDIKDVKTLFAHGAFDVVVTNPPYRPLGHGEQNHKDAISIAKHEVLVTLRDVLESAAHALKDKGKLFLVHRSDRLGEIMAEMARVKITPKILQTVHSKPTKDAHLVLIGGLKNGGNGLKVVAPFVIYEEDGSFTKAYEAIYHSF